MFVNKIFVDKKEFLQYEYAKHCRDNEFLCGKEAFLFDEIDSDTKYIELLNEQEKSLIKFINEDYNNDKNKHYMKSFSKEEKEYFNYYINKVIKKNNIPKINKKYLNN